MRKSVRDAILIFLCILLTQFSPNTLTAQQIIKVGCGEYCTTYLTSAGNLYETLWNGNTPHVVNVGLTNVVDIDGAQYTNIARQGDGKVYVVGYTGGTSFTTLVDTDSLGAPFNDVSKVYGWYQSYLAIRNDGTVWTWNERNRETDYGIIFGMQIDKPIQLDQPPGKVVTKLAVSTQGQYSVLALCSDGTVWKYTNRIPVQLAFSGTAVDITAVGGAAYIIKTTTDLLACGYLAGYVGGNNWSQNGPFISIKAAWQAAGAVFPLKEIVGNYNTLHVIDANDNMFASGSNVQGEIGNGIEYSPWRTRPSSPWHWNFANNELVTSPVQIPGKFKNVCSSNTITWYKYAQDMGGNWYSWGRNKSLALGNGVTLTTNEYAIWPNAMDVPAPQLVTPLSQVWNVAAAFDTNAVPLPISNPGINQYISTNSTTLYGQGSSQQEGTIIAYAWTKLSGPACSVTDTSSMNTDVTGLSSGMYVFRLTVTNNLGITDSRNVTVAVTSNNQPPVANAGTDQVITLPISLITLSGQGTDADGNISSYQWRKISGPALGIILLPIAQQTNVISLQQGTYKFELTVTDNNGATGKDTMQVSVNQAPNVAPTANAGTDISITLPVNTATLSGSGTDVDGTVSSYQWKKISGSATATITNATAATATAGNLTPGIYTYELTVTDNNGATGKDTVQVTVNPAPNVPPVANAGPDIIITLPANTVSLAGMGTDIDGTITFYQWLKISGPATGSITGATSANVIANSLLQGVYKFELTVTDNSGATGKDTVQVTVNPAPNVAPTANAGNNASITLPVNTKTLTGSGTDPDGTIVAWQWTKVSGPAAGTITNPTAALATANNLVSGIYKFELAVTDNSGATGKDTMQLSVNAASNIAPTAHAGTDIVISLPVNTTQLNGSGTDPDGTIAGYQWRKISGPVTGTIANATVANPALNNLVAGTYKFELTVTDNMGSADWDTVQVTVNPLPNIAPTAHAGGDIVITLPINTTQLNGSGTDPDGTITGYQWRKISGPASGSIVNVTSATATATSLVSGVYQFELTVTDNSGATGKDTMQLVVNAALNIPPTANAGADIIITLPTNTTQLSGSGTDVDGTITSYQWTKIAGPAAGTILNAASANPVLNNLVIGVYKFKLTVTDNAGSIDKDTVQVTVNPMPNIPPTANAGNNASITLPVSAKTLTGSGTDPDGTIVAWQWTKISGPASGIIANATSAIATASNLTLGVYRFELAVTDNSGATGKDTMQLSVNAAPNFPPTANAGTDIIITLPTNTTQLSGNGTDIDGIITGYQWTKISGPVTGTILNATSPNTVLNNLVQGLYKFELTITDNTGSIDRDTVQVTVNPAPNVAPTANAGNNASITLPVNTKTLTGSGTDPDGTIVAWQWTKVFGPAAGTITNPTAAVATANNLVSGIYKFELAVTDNSGATGKDTMQLSVNAASNIAPTAHAGTDIVISLPVNATQLNGSGTDPDGTIAGYQWRKISGPVTGTIANATVANPALNNLVAGTYKFELTVTDNMGSADWDTVQVTVNPLPNIAPTAHAGGDIVITLPINTTQLNGSGTDPDGTITGYQWRKISGPASGSIVNVTSATATATSLVSGVYEFELTVTDNSGATGKDTMLLNVNPAAAPINIVPVADAGTDIIITLPTNSVALNGTGVDPDGTITGYQWNKISGPVAGAITNATAATATATSLAQGIYQYELTVTDNNGAMAKDTVQVTVNTAAAPPNLLPIANAGTDQSIILPTDSTRLNGSGTDPDGTIVAYQWTKISGPAAGTIANATATSATARSLVQGVYQFELTVTDNNGATAKDTMQLVVNPLPVVANIPPVANAGTGQEIYLPDNAVMLAGTGTDADGYIVSYKWTIISGPLQYLLQNPVNAQTDFSNLAAGVYQVQLMVTDNDGATGVDTVSISVGASRLMAVEDDLKIYPNPVWDIMTLQISSSSVNNSVKIVISDVKGALLLKKEIKITQDIQLEKIDMTQYQKGTYFIEANINNKNHIVRKIIKM